MILSYKEYMRRAARGYLEDIVSTSATMSEAARKSRLNRTYFYKLYTRLNPSARHEGRKISRSLQLDFFRSDLERLASIKVVH